MNRRLRTMSVAVVSFALGTAPGMAIELARRGLSDDLRPDADEMEKMLKSATATQAK